MILEGKYEVDHNIYYEFDRKQRPIGEGGMGVVYKGTCVNRETNAIRDVAIKEIHIEADDPSFVEAIVERARREASIKFNNDNLIEMLGFVEVEDVKFNTRRTRYYVISEFLQGVTLQDALQGKCNDYLGVPVSAARELHEMYRVNREDTACKIIKNILYGVTALHDKGYIHRDIDPSNIMITEDGKIKLFDFGIAKKSNALNSRDDLVIKSGGMVGKAKYAAPELISAKIDDQCSATDIYSIGVLFYELLTGRLPFEGDDAKVIDGHLHQKPNLELIHNERYRSIVAKAMAKNPDKRYSSSSEMRVALDSSTPNPSRFPLLTVAVAVTLCIALLLCIYFIPNPDSNHDTDLIVSINPIEADTVKAEIKDTEQVQNTLQVQTILNSSIDELWDIISKDSNHPVALYGISKYYENRRLDKRAEDFWKYTLNKEVERYIKGEKYRSVVRFTFITATRAYDNVENYVYDNDSFIQELETLIKALLKEHPDNFDYPLIEY